LHFSPIADVPQEQGSIMIETLNKAIHNFVILCAIALSVVSIYTAFFGTFETMTQRTMHLTVICVMGLFIHRLKSAKDKPGLDLTINLVLAVLFVAANVFLFLNWKELYVSPFMDTPGLLLGLAAIVILLEVTRRTVGLSLAIIVILFLVYTYFGNYIPGFLGHRGYDLERIVVQVFAGTEGIYGIPLAVCSTIVIIFLIFGAFLDKAGASRVLLELSTSVAGRYRGGPAKVAIAASGLMGMLSGSSAANAATTGAITIPMMKKSGVEPVVAGAIEAVASAGGYKTPPIMGAVAFVMANMLGVNYADVCVAAALPAFFHYLGLFFMVDFYAGYKGLAGLPPERLSRFWPSFTYGPQIYGDVCLRLLLAGSLAGCRALPHTFPARNLSGPQGRRHAHDTHNDSLCGGWNYSGDPHYDRGGHEVVGSHQLFISGQHVSHLVLGHGDIDHTGHGSSAGGFLHSVGGLGSTGTHRHGDTSHSCSPVYILLLLPVFNYSPRLHHSLHRGGHSGGPPHEDRPGGGALRYCALHAALFICI
jgi:hypothetical protein